MEEKHLLENFLHAFVKPAVPKVFSCREEIDKFKALE